MTTHTRHQINLMLSNISNRINDVKKRINRGEMMDHEMKYELDDIAYMALLLAPDLQNDEFFDKLKIIKDMDINELRNELKFVADQSRFELRKLNRNIKNG